MNNQKEYYNILGVSQNSSQDDIKKAFRRLSLRHHPDRGGNKDDFQKINEAFQTLGDPQKRKHYDSGGSFPFGGVNGNDDIDKFFSAIFGGQQNMFSPFGHGMPNVRVFHNGQPVHFSQQKPKEIIKTVEIDISDAYIGINMPITIERWIFQSNEKKYEKEKIYIPIPKGIDNGEIIILKNKGNIINETNKGDIKIYIKINNTSNFERKGLDLYLDKQITLKESLTGFIFQFTHLNSKVYKINNEEGNIIPPNYVKKIANLGMNREHSKGSLYIKFNIHFPESLTEQQIKQLKDIL